MGSSSQMHKPNTSWHKEKKRLRTPPPQMQVHQTCAKAAHGLILASVIVPTVKDRGQGIWSVPGESSPLMSSISSPLPTGVSAGRGTAVAAAPSISMVPLICIRTLVRLVGCSSTAAGSCTLRWGKKSIAVGCRYKLLRQRFPYEWE
jgi:hypothetical protein